MYPVFFGFLFLLNPDVNKYILEKYEKLHCECSLRLIRNNFMYNKGSQISKFLNLVKSLEPFYIV